MNAAARLLNQGSLSRSWVITFVMTRSQISTVILVLSVLTSALSVVYVTNLTRSYNTDLQQMLLERNNMHVQWGQLLLEKSTALMQAKVQQTAEEKLQMIIPNGRAVVIVNESHR